MITKHKITKTSILTLLAIGLFLFIAIPTQAGNNWYVSKNGNNADGKTWNTAWDELNQIDWSKILPGDTVYIDGGSSSMTYTTGTRVRANGALGQIITITRSNESSHNGIVYITPSSGGVFNITSMAYVKFDGLDKTKFILDGKNNPSTRGFYSWIEGSPINNIEIANMIIANMPNSGIYFRHYSVNNHFHHLEIYGCGAGGSSYANFLAGEGSAPSNNSLHHSIIREPSTIAVSDNIGLGGSGGFDIYDNIIYQLNTAGSADNLYITASNIKVYNNFIYAQANGGNQYIYVFTGSNGIANPDNILIYNNVFWKSAPSDSCFPVVINSRDDDGGGCQISNVKIYNNTFHNGGYAIYVRSFTAGTLITNVDIKNNIFHIGDDYNSKGAVTLSGDNAINNTTFDYNYYDKNSEVDGTYPNQLFINRGATRLTLAQVQSLYGQETHGDTGDPKFIDPTNKDFHLQSESPAKDRGSDLSSYFTTDKDSTSRPQGSAWDIGAYEYQGPSQPTCNITGDLDCSGSVTVSDIQLAINVFLGTETRSEVISRSDLNNDGKTNVIDIQRIINIVLGG